MAEWAALPGYEGIYEVSSDGRVKSLARETHNAHATWTLPERVAGLHEDRKGYLYFVASRDGDRRRYYVHQAVMHAFVGPQPEGAEVCHGNGQNQDNRLENLRYDTRSGNQRDRAKHGTHHYGNRDACSKGHPYPRDPKVRRRDFGHGQVRARVCETCTANRVNERSEARRERRRLKKARLPIPRDLVLRCGYSGETRERALAEALAK